MLSDNEILRFYKFVYVFEKCLNCISKDKTLSELCPISYGKIKNAFSKVTIKTLTEISDIESVSSGLGSISRKQKKGMRFNKYCSLCAHLRNSFVHALIQPEGNDYIVVDKDDNGNRTAYFKISKNILLDIVDSFWNELGNTSSNNQYTL